MRIALGTVNSNLCFAEDLQLIKGSLLYADEVELIGMAEYALYQYLPQRIIATNDISEMLAWMIPLLKSFDNDKARDLVLQCEELNQKIKLIEPKLKKQKYRSKQEILAQAQIKKSLGECKGALKSCLENLLDQPESKTIQALVERGIISVFDYEFDGLNMDELTGGYFANLVGTMKHGLSYPLFDKMSADLVGSLISDKSVDISRTDKEVLRHAGIAVEILSTLPTLEGASVDEIIDFKRDLKTPLTSFRRAIYGFSEKIESLPWDDDFQYDCLKIYYSDVLPQINEINELVSETSVLKNFGGKVLSDGEMRRRIGFVGAGLAATITTGMNMSTALGVVEQIVRWGGKIGLSAAGVEAFLKTTDLLNKARKEVKQKKTELDNNVMYYYYLASTKL